MYYIMDWQVPSEHVAVRLEMLDEFDEAWRSGRRFSAEQAPPNPLRFRFDPEREGTLLLDFYQSPAVLMSKRLVTTLQSAGVDNLDLYPATIVDEETGKVYDSHVAVNIIGKVSAADLAESRFDPAVPDRMVTAAFDSLAVDDASARGQLFFRLAERIGAVVVHDQVKDRVEAAGFETILFEAPADWSSL